MIYAKTKPPAHGMFVTPPQGRVSIPIYKQGDSNQDLRGIPPQADVGIPTPLTTEP